MNRSRAVVAVVVLVPVALFVGIPIMRFVRSNQEIFTLDDQARHRARGSFVRLPDGVTHYQLGGAISSIGQLGGPEGGRTVVFIPGFSTPYNIWDPTYDALGQAGFQVLRYDLFGRGWSDRPAAAYDADFYVKQLADLLDALGFSGPVHLAGVSMGGPIAVTFAARHPERVKSVLLFDPGYFTGFELNFPLRAPILGEYHMAVTVSPGLPKSQWEDFAHPERYPHYLDPYYEQMRYPGFRRALLATLRNYVSKDTSGDYRTLGKSGKPVLLIWGKADRDTPIALSKKILEAVPQAEFHVIDEIGRAHV